MKICCTAISMHVVCKLPVWGTPVCIVVGGVPPAGRFNLICRLPVARRDGSRVQLAHRPMPDTSEWRVVAAFQRWLFFFFNILLISERVKFFLTMWAIDHLPFFQRLEINNFFVPSLKIRIALRLQIKNIFFVWCISHKHRNLTLSKSVC